MSAPRCPSFPPRRERTRAPTAADCSYTPKGATGGLVAALLGKQHPTDPSPTVRFCAMVIAGLPLFAVLSLPLGAPIARSPVCPPGRSAATRRAVRAG